MFTRLRFLPLGLILIGLIYQKGLTIAKTIKWLTAVTTTKRTGGLNLQIFEWIVERDSISSLFWKHHFVENPLMSKMSHIVSRRSVLARAQQLQFRTLFSLRQVHLGCIIFPPYLSSHSFTDLSDRSVFRRRPLASQVAADICLHLFESIDLKFMDT